MLKLNSSTLVLDFPVYVYLRKTVFENRAFNLYYYKNIYFGILCFHLRIQGADDKLGQTIEAFKIIKQIVRVNTFE
jgi:hypothetical protein